MQSDYTTNPDSIDPLVRRLVQEYRKLSDTQQSQFQRVLINGNDIPLEIEDSRVPVTWKDMEMLIKPIEWDWKGWLAKGFLTIIASESGMGKSTLALRVGACYLLALPWPDGANFLGETGCILWCESEAGQALNLDRARKWRLPLEKIYIPLSEPLDDVLLESTENLDAVKYWSVKPEVKLIVVDSLRGTHRGDEDSSNMFGVVVWLAQLARDSGKPVLLLHHLRKNSKSDLEDVTLDRVRGSSAIVQPSRLVWAIDMPDLQNKESKRLSVIKSNIGRFPNPIGLQIQDDGIVFGKPPEPPKKNTQLNKAADLLQSLLEKEPQSATEVEEAIKAYGISKRTADEAKKRLGIESVRIKKGDKFEWYWTLPAKDARLEATI